MSQTICSKFYTFLCNIKMKAANKNGIFVSKIHMYTYMIDNKLDTYIIYRKIKCKTVTEGRRLNWIFRSDSQKSGTGPLPQERMDSGRSHGPGGPIIRGWYDGR